MPDTGGTLRKNTHQTLGHAPASLADWETVFAPNTSNGGWHRGDGNFMVHGAGWTLSCHNDFFVSDGAGGVMVLFRRNSVLMTDTATGVVSWLSSGDQFPIPGSVTFPAPASSGHHCWLEGGWATGASSAILFAGRWTAATVLLDLRVMGIAGITGASPTCTAVLATDLPVGTVGWTAQPYSDGNHVHLHGFANSTLTHHVARHAYSTAHTDYVTGWEFWTGTGWSSAFADRGAVVIASAPARSLTVRPWADGWLATSKDFDTAPEIAIPDVWPEIKCWHSPNITGPWTYFGILYQPVTLATWYSYAGRVEELPGVSGLTAIWSLNKGAKTPAEFDVYGPQLAAASLPVIGYGAGSGENDHAPASPSSGGWALAGRLSSSALATGTGTSGQASAGSASGSHSG